MPVELIEAEMLKSEAYGWWQLSGYTQARAIKLVITWPYGQRGKWEKIGRRQLLYTTT